MQAQSLESKLQQAFQRFDSDAQLKYASVGFCVQNEAGNTIFARSENTGLVPASTQKIVTASAALHLLGTAHTFGTRIGYSGKINGQTLAGDLLLHGSGDPTMGSWRYLSKPDTAIFWQVYQLLLQKGIRQINGDLVGSNTRFSPVAVPGGWIYDDMGNYYGAGSWALNYHENQYDASFDTKGNTGTASPLVKQEPDAGLNEFRSFVKVGKPGSGDNSIIYASPYSNMAFATGTLGQSAKPFTISGAITHGEQALLQALKSYLQQKGISIMGMAKPAIYFTGQQKPVPGLTDSLGKYQSVTLDSVVYWFLQKSINLYGESLVKALSHTAGNMGETEAGVSLIRNFWADKGIEKEAMRMIDGSGLSPQNRITPLALVQVLQFAKKQSWFPAFYEGLPTIHQIKMKSGTISGAKGYTGYISDRNGKQYCFALLVNNYTGSANAIVQKMWQLLDTISAY